MKIIYEIGECDEEEVVIRCRRQNELTDRIQKAINKEIQSEGLVFTKGSVDYYLPTDDILFFETAEGFINAHTCDDAFTVKSKLYILEEILPPNFVRASKSTILNINHVYSIDKSITSFSTVSFAKTHKQVFVSRKYLKNLTNALALTRKHH